MNMQACLEAWQILLKMRNVEKEQKALNAAGTIESLSAQNFWHPWSDGAVFGEQRTRLAWGMVFREVKLQERLYSVQKVG